MKLIVHAGIAAFALAATAQADTMVFTDRIGDLVSPEDAADFTFVGSNLNFNITFLFLDSAYLQGNAFEDIPGEKVVGTIAKDGGVARAFTAGEQVDAASSSFDLLADLIDGNDAPLDTLGASIVTGFRIQTGPTDGFEGGAEFGGPVTSTRYGWLELSRAGDQIEIGRYALAEGNGEAAVLSPAAVVPLPASLPFLAAAMLAFGVARSRKA